MEKNLVEAIGNMSLSEAEELQKNDPYEQCRNCGLWPCYATPDDCVVNGE